MRPCRRSCNRLKPYLRNGRLHKDVYFVTEGTSPAASGPAGSHFEGQVGASYLLAMLVNAEPRGLPGTIIDRVELQRGAEGYPLDDVIVHAMTRPGTRPRWKSKLSGTLPSPRRMLFSRKSLRKSPRRRRRQISGIAVMNWASRFHRVPTKSTAHIKMFSRGHVSWGTPRPFSSAFNALAPPTKTRGLSLVPSEPI